MPLWLLWVDCAGFNRERRMNEITEIVYTWPDGREEVRYRRIYGSDEAIEFVKQVLHLQLKHGVECPYSYRHVTKQEPTHEQ